MLRGFIPLFLSACALSSTSVSALSYNESQNEENRVELLFIQTAKEAVISKNRSNNGKFVLTLKGVNPEIAYFSDRPKRIAGKTSIQIFLNEWSRGSQSFKADNPNAALVTRLSHSSSHGDSQENMVVLTNPRYDPRRNTLSYDIEPISNNSAIEEGVHKDPVLFIDSSCFNLC